MNRTKIEWCDYTWNPVTGCLHNCPYCYAERISKRFTGDFEPKFHENRLTDPQKVKTPSKIFVVSMGDLFGEWVPDEWIRKVLESCERAPQHAYLFLTKNPAGMLPYEFPENMWVGASVENHQDAENRLPRLLRVKAAVRFVSLEPMLAPVDLSHVQLDRHTNMNVLEGCGVSLRSHAQSMPNAFCEKLSWVIVGAQTGPDAVKPDPDWVQDIIDQCRSAGVPIFLKDNLEWPDKIQEWPRFS